MTIETCLPQPEVASMAPLIDQLACALEREAIVYCHWKSNINLAQSMAGDLDLDMLVDRRCLLQAKTILSRLGFKAAVVRRGPVSPGISHYYGLDDETGQLVHVHLFSIVLTGESYVKSHLFPFETMLLENVYYSGQMRVTAKQAELVAFTLRMFVKYGSLPDLLTLWNKSESLKKEVRWLQDGGDLTGALALLRKHCPVVEERLFIKCIETLNSDSSFIRRIILAQQVRRRLKVYARHALLARLLAYGQVFWAEVQRRLGKKQKNKTLHAGGTVIAFVGAEATGKSTLVAETERWLGGAFAVRTVHAGKPPPTLSTAPISLLLPWLRRALSSLRTNQLEGHIAAAHTNSSSAHARIKGLTSLVYALRSVILAWERRQLLVHARRAAANGELVICDRYPSHATGAMDSPRLRQRPTQRGVIPAIFNRLARLEQRLYEEVAPPDIVLRLNVTVETARRRNRERIKARKESDDYVASRHRQTREWQRTGTKYVYDIDTEQSLPETIRHVKKVVWESL